MKDGEKIENTKKLKPVYRAIIEAGSIIFLFYSNLLMGEYSHSGLGNTKGFLWALQDIFTGSNFCIAAISSLVGYLGIEFLRRKL
ncbi:MAG TPA: hypothetical protein VK809_09420 [Bacteroidia bacterium]|jgi:hypothetical protein|nr:hypothetical protein [Bacteroidia bacterium]